MKIYRLLSVLPIMMLYTCIAAQNASSPYLNTLTEKFIKTINNDNREKILFQTDRKIYAAGEKIWFKAFLLHQSNNTLDTASKNLFVDIVTDKDSTISKLALNVTGFNTDGAINLNSTLKTGSYWLRCYTRKMLAEDVNSIYIQPVFVYNLRNKLDGYAPAGKANTTDPVISFFPERLANAGVKSSLYLKITEGNNKPVITPGEIVTEHDSVV